MHALECMLAYYNNSETDDIYRVIVGILFQNIYNIEKRTIYELADMCHASPTTISRLSRKLGYQSFQEFKKSLVDSVKNYDILNRYVPFNELGRHGGEIEAYLILMKQQVENLAHNVDIRELDELVHMIHNCEKVNFYTNGTNFAECRFQEDLIMAGHISEVKTIPTEQQEDITTLTDKDLVIMIAPVVQDGLIVNDLMKMIKERGAHLFVLTDSYYPPYQRYADDMYSFDGVLGIIDDYRFAMYLNLLSMRFRHYYLK